MKEWSNRLWARLAGPGIVGLYDLKQFVVNNKSVQAVRKQFVHADDLPVISQKKMIHVRGTIRGIQKKGKVRVIQLRIPGNTVINCVLDKNQEKEIEAGQFVAISGIYVPGQKHAPALTSCIIEM